MREINSVLLKNYEFYIYTCSKAMPHGEKIAILNILYPLFIKFSNLTKNCWKEIKKFLNKGTEFIYLIWLLLLFQKH